MKKVTKMIATLVCCLMFGNVVFAVSGNSTSARIYKWETSKDSGTIRYPNANNLVGYGINYGTSTNDFWYEFRKEGFFSGIQEEKKLYSNTSFQKVFNGLDFNASYYFRLNPDGPNMSQCDGYGTLKD